MLVRRFVALRLGIFLLFLITTIKFYYYETAQFRRECMAYRFLQYLTFLPLVIWDFYFKNKLSLGLPLTMATFF